MGFMLYFAGNTNKQTDHVLIDNGANRLFSQLLDRKGCEEWIKYSREVEHRNLFIDSGAYSVHTKGKEVDVDEYIQYVNDRQGCFQAIAQVDKIPGEFGKPKTLQQLAEAPELSWENYLYMRDRVFDVDCLLPIFHQGEDFKHLKRMLEFTSDGKHIPYIGISPANDISKKHKDTWLSLVFKCIKDSSNPNVKTHAFGMTSLDILEKYPLYSADSTSWCLTAAMGSIMTPWGNILVSNVQLDNPTHVTKMSTKQIQQIDDFAKKYGFSLEQCSEEHTARRMLNALYLLDWAKNYKFKGTNKYQKRLF